MFEARLIEGSILKKIVDAIKDLVVTKRPMRVIITGSSFPLPTYVRSTYYFFPQGKPTYAMDSSHVALVMLKLYAKGFNPFRASHGVTLGITLPSLFKILKCAGADDIITLKSDAKSDSVTLMFESSKQTRISHFTLNLMDVTEELLKIPDITYPCVLKLPSEEFQRICREMTIMGDTVEISASKEGIRFSVNGELGTGSILCRSNDGGIDEESKEEVIVKTEETLALSFSLRYLNYFTKATPLSTYVTIKMMKEKPIIVEYTIGEDIGYIRYYLAPKITEGDDTVPS